MKKLLVLVLIIFLTSVFLSLPVSYVKGRKAKFQDSVLSSLESASAEGRSVLEMLNGLNKGKEGLKKLVKESDLSFFKECHYDLSELEPKLKKLLEFKRRVESSKIGELSADEFHRQRISLRQEFQSLVKDFDSDFSSECARILLLIFGVTLVFLIPVICFVLLKDSKLEEGEEGIE